MTARGFYTLLFGALMLFTALSVGSAGAFLLGTAAPPPSPAARSSSSRAGRRSAAARAA